MTDPYNRKPRGFPPDLPGDVEATYFAFRFSFLCRGCRKRTTPPSCRFLGRKVYVGPALILACRAIEAGRAISLEEIRRILQDFIPKVTARRWIAWWRGAVWISPFWRGYRGRMHGVIHPERLVCGVWEHFESVLTEGGSPLDPAAVVQSILGFFSPLTRPQNYPS
jgi:hypothetical protein